MQAKNNKKRILIITAIIVVGIVLFVLFVPNLAHAQLFDVFGDLGKDLLSWLITLVLNVLSFVVGLASSFFDKMMDIQFAKHETITKIGWEITRDFANMFFILFMIVVAFGTILRIEQYGIKKLLPKVIIIALLINFSLVISYLIIDISDIMARFFIDSAKKSGSISGVLADSLNIAKIYVPVDCKAEQQKTLTEKCEKLTGTEKDGCKANAALNFEFCKLGVEELKKEKAESATLISLFASMILGSVVLLVAAFVFFAGGILLVIRLLFLWFLVMIVPFVFICYIMPGLSSNWKKWWKTFLSWCFFAPIFSFFIWLAVKLSVERSFFSYNFSGGGKTATSQVAGTQFFSDIEIIISFIFTAGLLLGGLIAAKQLGLYGASTALNIAQKAGTGVKNWAARTSMRPVKAVGTAVGAGALTAGGKLFGGKIGRRMQAKGIQIKQKAQEEKQHKAYANLLKTMNNTDLLKEVESAKGVRGFIAAQEAKKRGVLREADRGVVQKAMKTYRAYGAPEEARSLEELRPDAVEDKTERKAAIERATKEGTHKKWSEKVFEDPEGTEVVEETRRQLGTGEFAKVFKGWARDIQEKAQEALRAGFTNNFDVRTRDGKDNIEKRKAFATITGKAHQSFFGDQNGVIQAGYRTNPNAQNEARAYIKSLDNEGFGNLKEDEDRALAAQYMTPSQVHGAGTKLSGHHKNQMRRVAQRLNPQAHRRMQTADTWA